MVVSFLLLLLAVACGTETGNPELLALSYNARSTEPDVVALDDAGSPAEAVLVDAVWLRLGYVRLTGDCDGEPVETRYDPLGFADHGHPDAAVQALAVTAETVCSVETSFDVLDDATGEPAPVAGTAVGLLGTLPDGRAFEALVRDPVAIALTLDDEPLPDEGSWLVTFDVATWVDADALLALPGDPVVVSDDGNVAAYDALVERLVDGVQLHHDADGDGRVDPDERRLDQ